MSNEFLQILGLALLPALGNFAGGLLAEGLRPSGAFLNRALHAATGVILAIISVEVMPEALGTAPAWLLALAFFGGGCAYLLLETAVDRWQQSKQTGAGTGAWMVYAAVTTDLLGDGLLIGAGAAVSTHLALFLALGQVLADVPEGFAVIANFRAKGVSRARRLLLAASFVVPVMATAALAYVALRGQQDAVQMTALVFVAGLFILAAVEDMLSEAHETAEDSRWSALSLIAGFALFLAVSNGLG
ncbi:MAG: peptidoglycan-binding protein [Thiohalocapsa sp.]|uniref:ZIP family metal transporter n=1 Tax=Thiohalocapsa sp. TaxID=2497641 RepID=UPI0025F939AD|nr:peptidoglycan-binding protein [Thiohalocapsa sp.]MCG6941658.1 peptidoglycan-binding protein [Thiohalocapsa sp.]